MKRQLKHCWHEPDVRMSTGMRGEPRRFICCVCGQEISMAPKYVPSKHGRFAPESAQGTYHFELPGEGCPTLSDAGVAK